MITMIRSLLLIGFAVAKKRASSAPRETVRMLLHQLALHVTSVLAAGPVNNPTPTSPVSGKGVSLLLGYAEWGSLISCAASALVSGGLMAVGHLSHRPEAGDRGKRALLWSLGGVAVVALAIPTINTVFGAVS
jgi:hypothetical protein